MRINTERARYQAVATGSIAGAGVHQTPTRDSGRRAALWPLAVARNGGHRPGQEGARSCLEQHQAR